ncbi:TetR/AcrR family transcriptional regulator [Parasphingopyxis sp.]|uniref:TetR/AcrR family transcriptional regulator n=1 Tax=Parasphingopyxis sp. TaxID=1920299 RepID=UPI00261D0539|nr:TetR/AcrR family transcriptional regulator [Parasphingopyxis sp.]
MAREKRRDQLMRAANTILIREGAKGLTMERLAEAASISKPVVYSHFGNRSELLVALFEQYWATMDRKIPQEPDNGESFEEYTKRSTGMYFSLVLSNDTPLREMMHKITEDPLVDEKLQQREKAVVDRSADLITKFYDIDREDAEYIGYIYRASLEAAASYLIKHPEKEAFVRSMQMEMAISLLQGIQNKPS